MSEERIFNQRRRWLLRNHISTMELCAAVLVLAALAAVVGWIIAQEDNFNAAERDLPFEVLAERPVEDRLYRTPTKSWISPDKAETAGTTLGGVDLGLFPRSILEGGWAISSRPRRFGPDTLFEKINGEAEKFLKQDFRQLHYIALKIPGGQDEIAIELFDQGGFAGGLGIFSDHRTKDRKVRRVEGGLYYTTPVGAIGFGGRYFYRIAANRESAAVTKKSGLLVRSFSALAVQEGQAPLSYRILTTEMGVDPATVAYQRSNAFQYDFAGQFWFGEPSSGGPGRYFIHQGASDQAAGGLFQAIAKEQALEFSVLNRTKNTVLMRHGFLKTHFFMALQGGFIYGMENEASVNKIRTEMARLAEVLRGKE